MTITNGTRLGSYEILARLGAGGMGEVWLAEDTRLGRNVALKILPPECAEDEGRVRRFEQETQVASALNHSDLRCARSLRKTIRLRSCSGSAASASTQ